MQVGPPRGGMEEDVVLYNVLLANREFGFGRSRTVFVWTGTGIKRTFPGLVAAVHIDYETRTRPVVDELTDCSGLGTLTG